MELLLVTGFLGAGKTTFLKRLLLLWKDRRIALIVNEFGQANIDGLLLSDLGASLREVTGGSVFCACRMDQFQAALSETVLQQPDIVLVEASGLSDPTAVKAGWVSSFLTTISRTQTCWPNFSQMILSAASSLL